MERVVGFEAGLAIKAGVSGQTCAADLKDDDYSVIADAGFVFKFSKVNQIFTFGDRASFAGIVLGGELKVVPGPDENGVNTMKDVDIKLTAGDVFSSCDGKGFVRDADVFALKNTIIYCVSFQKLDSCDEDTTYQLEKVWAPFFGCVCHFFERFFVFSLFAGFGIVSCDEYA